MDAPCWRCGSRLSCRHRKASDAPLLVYVDRLLPHERKVFHAAFGKAVQRHGNAEIFARLAEHFKPVGR